MIYVLRLITADYKHKKRRIQDAAGAKIALFTLPNPLSCHYQTADSIDNANTIYIIGVIALIWRI